MSKLSLSLRFKQQGLAAVEFAIVGAVFFMMLFAAIEVGRLMYNLTILNEVSRASARLAAVCAPGSAGIVTRSMLVDLPDLSPSNVSVTYLNANMVQIDPNAPSQFVNVRYVRTRIENFTIDLIIPGAEVSVPSPAFETTLPSESLGVSPLGTVGAVAC